MSMTLGQAQDKLNAYVTVTPAFIKERYDHWNQAGFGGELPHDVIFLAASLPGTTAGLTRMKFNTTAPMRLMKIMSDPSKFVKDMEGMSVTITTKVKMTSEVFDGILLHEMVHVAMFTKGLVYQGHGHAFMAKLREVEKRTGKRIPVGHDVDQRPGDFPEFDAYPAKDVLLVVWRKRGMDAFTMVSTKAKDQLPAFLEKIRKRHGIIYGDHSTFEAYETKTPLASMFVVHRSFSVPLEFRDLKDGSKLDAAIKAGNKLG